MAINITIEPIPTNPVTNPPMTPVRTIYIEDHIFILNPRK